MGKVGRLIKLVNAKAFHPIEPSAPHDKRAEGSRLSGTDNNELQLAAGGEGRRTGLNPCILVHRTVGLFGKESPALSLVINRTELMDNPHR
jgi:hypothetical protein